MKQIKSQAKEVSNIDTRKEPIVIAKKTIKKKSVKVTKTELINELYSINENKITKIKIKQIVDAVFDIIAVYLKYENVEVKINDFAKFVTITNKESFKNDLITGEKRLIPAYKNVKFRPSKNLKERMNS